MIDPHDKPTPEAASRPGDEGHADLRTRAESLAASLREAAQPNAPTSQEVQSLLHELRVHQIELEMQNEELRRAQELLEASRALFFDLYDLAPIGYCTVSEGGTILRSNLRAAEILGSERAALVHQAIVRFIAHSDRQAYLECIRLLLDTGVGQSLELQMLRASGTKFWAEVALSAAQDSGGVKAVRLVITDTSERRARDEQLHQLSLAVEQSPDVVVITDVDGNLEYVNEAFVRNTGYTRDVAIGANCRILRSPRVPAETYTALWATISSGENWKGELINRRRDGTEYVDSTIVSPLRGSGGRITHYVSVQRDITEKKRMREEIALHREHLEELVVERTAELTAARAQAQAANAAKSAFLANMSHEIRTPMNAIIGLTQLLRRSGARQDQLGRLDKIDAAGHHLLAIINDVLDLSKIEAGHLELHGDDFDLSLLFNSVVSFIATETRQKGLELEVDLGKVPRWLNGDSTRLRQALLNYASNAVKFTDTGMVRLTASLLDETPAELHIRFAVEDSGIGIAPDQIGRLFGIFEQVDASPSRRHGGTGLGLAITKRLAALMGGAVGVESAPGIGSTFWFTARLGRSHRAASVLSAAPDTDIEAQLRQRHGGARLLVAEDNPVNLEVALEVLNSVGLIVDAATNGAEALEKARAHHYDMVLMDMQMPVMDGLEATTAIRGLPGWEVIPIFAMTANVFGDDRQACLAAGMDDFVSKPVKWNALWSLMLKWLPSDPANKRDARRNIAHAPSPHRRSLPE